MDPEATPTPQPRSWWSRNWKWVVPVGCLLPFVAMGGCLTFFVVVAFGSLKSSDAYTHSLAAMRADGDVQAALGSPIDPAFLVSGNIQVGTQGGHADIAYDISGPKGKATVYAIADKEAGDWVFKTLVVKVESSGENIDVLANQEADAAANEAI